MKTGKMVCRKKPTDIQLHIERTKIKTRMTRSQTPYPLGHGRFA